MQDADENPILCPNRYGSKLEPLSTGCTTEALLLPTAPAQAPLPTFHLHPPPPLPKYLLAKKYGHYSTFGVLLLFRSPYFPSIGNLDRKIPLR